MKTATDFPATIIPVVLALVVGACSSDVLTLAVPQPEPNRAPVAVGSIPTATVAVDGTHRVDAAAYFSDPDGDGLSYAAASSDPGLARVSVAGSAVTVTGVAKGEATVTVTASDGNGGTAHQVFAVIVPNRAPEATAAAHDLVLEVGGPARDVNLADWFSDPDGDSLVYAAASTDTAVFRVRAMSGSVVRVEAGKAGTAALEAAATDSEGLSVGKTVAVSVSDDRAVLEALYHATGGPDFWTRSDNWLTDAPLNGWYGVKADSDGRVKALELGGNSLNGTIPPEIGNLTALEHLYLGGNRLTGPIPPEIGNLAALKALRLFQNALSGPLPLQLANLAALEDLNLDYNAGLCTPDDSPRLLLAWLSALNVQPPERCAVLRAALVGDRAALEALYHATGGPNWERSDNWLTDAPPKYWDGVSTDSEGRVWNVQLHRNGLSGTIPAEISNLTAVVALSLDDNDLAGAIPPEIGNLAAMEWLSLNGNNLTGSIPPEIGNLAALAGRAEGRPTLGSHYLLRLGDNDLSGLIPPELATPLPV